MATFEIRDGQLALEFSPLEKLGGLRSGATVELKDIHTIEKVDDPWDILDGLRFGTGIPWVIVLGTMLRQGGNDVVAVYRRDPAVVVTLRPGAPYQRLIATVPQPEQVVATLQTALENERRKT
ncbi:hypothetical protein J8C02_03185 [Chloracidobacterium sp. MS 40/45]|uniref:hypothetical protein n=1 Tax=Chloracidobacterium aggregatum TaxID=2851959 RepID=UPI001B8BF677|nr:hypothetical protein [Chloracidobacterium aggregatum]QUW00514.1 hypothetical protein J8C02_03185 [Chloracidobacterium sp. MS 40/45]